MGKKHSIGQKNIMTFTREECLLKYKEILAKAGETFESAQLLAKEKKFSTATALLISSNEDLLKAFILYLDGVGFRFRSVKGMRSIFENHKLRYLLALVLSFMLMFEADMIRVLNICKRFPFLLKRIQEKQDENFGFDTPKFKARIKRYLVNKLTQASKEVEFFSMFDKVRQQGLYSDFNDGVLFTINEGEFQNFYKKISDLNTTIHILIPLFGTKEEEMKWVIDKLKTDFSRGYYDNLENLLSIINKPGYNSYQTLSKTLSKMSKEILNKENWDI